LFLYNSTKLI